MIKMKPNLLCSLLKINKPVMVLFVTLVFASVSIRVHSNYGDGQPAYSLKDTVKFKSFSGRVLDKNSMKPLVFADVQLSESNIGVVTNTDGDFIIKVPDKLLNHKLTINHLGYKNTEINLSLLNKNVNIIYLEAITFPIAEVKVRKTNPEDLLRAAIRNKSANYSNNPVMMTSFYRETIKQNKNYVAVAEAVMDIYKAPYFKTSESDRSKIFKGRKSQDVKKMDTVIVKMQGGPYTSLLLDVVKNPGDILSEDLFELYDYKLEGINYINDREAYVISFRQKERITEPLYEGNIYLDYNNLAIAGLDFHLNTQNIEKATNLLVRKKPATMKIDVLGANYLTRYRELNGIWYLAYVRSELELKCKWDKKLFSSYFTLMSEMAVTDLDQENVDRLKFKDQTKYSDILAEQVSQFEDPDYWGDYNIIKPDESIEDAIGKLNRRLKKQL
jgi:hypothetical protein